MIRPIIDAGIIMLIGIATFFIICFPTVINISAGSSNIVLLSANHVPQKRPVIRTSSKPVMSCMDFCVMVITFRMSQTCCKIFVISVVI